jgi:hypothetical protein
VRKRFTLYLFVLFCLFVLQDLMERDGLPMIEMECLEGEWRPQQGLDKMVFKGKAKFTLRKEGELNRTFVANLFWKQDNPLVWKEESEKTSDETDGWNTVSDTSGVFWWQSSSFSGDEATSSESVKKKDSPESADEVSTVLTDEVEPSKEVIEISSDTDSSNSLKDSSDMDTSSD